jgi:hypothetical protein
MGHVRLGTLPTTRKWRSVVDLIAGGGSVEEIARASAVAAESDLKRAKSDPVFLYVARLLVELPLAARGPEFAEALVRLGLQGDAPTSLADLAAAVSDAVDRHGHAVGRHSDLGEMAQMALVESLTSAIAPQLPGLLAPERDEVRRALGRLSSGDRFAAFARSFFARLTERTLDYYLSRELANHIGPDKRFANSAERSLFDRALATHAFEASRIVEDFAGGWYGKTIWQRQGLTPDGIERFVRFAFQKITNELGRRREAA